MASLNEVKRNSLMNASTFSMRSANETGESFVVSDQYQVYNNYYDENYSTIDSSKNISVNASQINITQETNSQYIPFKMSRYWDGIDLMDMSIQIHWSNNKGQGDVDDVVNVCYSDSTITFGWLVDDYVTSIAGDVKFEITASGLNEKNERYKWRTKPNGKLTVLEALTYDDIVEPTADWYTAFENKMLLYITEAKTHSDVAKESEENALAVYEQMQDDLENLSANVQETVETNILNAVKENHYTKTEADKQLAELRKFCEDIDSLQQLKVDYDNNTGKLTFTNHESEEKETIVSEVTINSLANLKVKYEVVNGKGTLSFMNNDVEITSTDIGDINPSTEWTTAFQKEISKDITSAVSTLEAKVNANKESVNEELASIHNTIDGLPETLQSDYYTKTDTDSLLEGKASTSSVTDVSSKVSTLESAVNVKVDAIESSVNTNKTNITTLSEKIVTFEETLNGFDNSPQTTYEATYDEEQLYTLWEIQGEGENEVRTAKSQFKIAGGGGASTSSILKIEYVTTSPVVATVNDKVEITYRFSGTDSSGDIVSEGDYTWKIGSRVIATGIATNGENTFDATDFVSLGSQKLTLSITDAAGSLVTKTWTVQKIDVKLESNFNDTFLQPMGEISFDYTPYGSISKEVHFILDGKELPSITTSASGVPMSYTLPAQEHGAHFLEVYMTATINNVEIESNHIYKDIIWFDETSDVPVIGCRTPNIVAKQYDSTNIEYVVYDNSTETPRVTLAVDGNVISNLTLSQNVNTWQYKTADVGKHVLTITCKETVKTINVEIEELDITISPVLANLAFDFNPIGRTNNDEDRLWSDKDITMSVSENFDWVNGGYQIDENGDQYFCVKSGTQAVINYNLFADDPKRNGKEFKLVFKTTNVKNRDTSFVSCMNDGIGLDMKVEGATIYSSNKSLYSPYCEEDIIEFEFNINKDTDIPMVLTYEDGVGNRPMIYSADASFMQLDAQPITIGSNNCDVHIYRMKAYSASLSDRDILSNFIADARSADEMIARYNRNDIYEDGVLKPEVLAEKCPDLRIILIDCPWFTNDKDDKVKNTTIQMIYKGGDPVLDNWVCTGASHSGQGTSSNEYGYAGRNLRLIMNNDESEFTLGDGKTKTDKITLTRNSVPNAYYNVKVNIASSENQNNAQLARRYNDYNPVVRPAKVNDPRVKDTMEFYNCVVFVRENDPDITKHREFKDCDNYHFYALGNIGDDKKTDKSRMNDSSDPKECIIEITDYDVVLAEFPTGKDGICPVSEWKAGNDAYDKLYADYEYEAEVESDGTTTYSFKSFGSKSYEFRYEKKGITDEQRQVNIDAWREFYKFVVTSSDEEFHARLHEYFVVDSALYYYLFTERYTCVDNRAKNTFWHYGKCADGIYRWDLCFAYDKDTSLGIDNVGKLVLTYGKEDTDYYVDGDPSSSYIYRAAESTFFCRIRDLFKDELQAMFVNRESAGAWSSASLINQWDKAQSEFPEEIWRLDIQRKYLRTYLGISVDNSIEGAKTPRFLEEMLNGRKKYQRRMFERNQELYFATKYFGTTATSDQIMMRFNNPVGATIKQDFTLYLTPYSDMYIGVKRGNTTPTNFRAKAGVEYTIPYDGDTADITLIYGASFIQAIGDLSKCYIGDNDFSKASRLQRLVIGSDVAGYSNNYLTQLTLGNNKLLEYLDIRNTTAINSVVDLSQCSNLIELRAENSGATGVIFANGGKVETAYIPDVISLTMKNLNYLETFNMAGYNNLQLLIVENTPAVNTYNIINNAPMLNTLRLIGMNWDASYQLKDTAILDRALTFRGVDASGYTVDKSVLTGAVHTAVAKEKSLQQYNETWNDLNVTYDALINQFTVTFVNADDEETVLDVQYVDKGGNAVNPITRAENPIPIPTLKSTVSTNFTFKEWDTSLDGVFADRVVKATYSESVRDYTVKYVSKGTVLQTTVAPYGSLVSYEGDTPVYTAEESAYKYNLFSHWDNSGLVNGDKTINAVFESCEYVEGYFNNKELSTMSKVEIYAMMKLGLEQNVLSIKDSINFEIGNDFSASDIEEVVIIDKKTEFNGTNHIDTGISLMELDCDWTLACDFSLSAGNKTGATLMQCMRNNGMDGFKLWVSNGSKLSWGTASMSPTMDINREMLVMRHEAGSPTITVYTSNINGTEISVQTLTAIRNPVHPYSLVLGAAKADDGVIENHCVGTVYWCKLWKANLGDSVCSDIAQWTHEVIPMELAKFRAHYLSDDPAKMSKMTFLATNLMSINSAFCNSNSNSGGWATSVLNTKLNTRLTKAISPLWKALIKPVIVASSIGGKSSDVSNSNCYFYIPAVYDLDNSKNTEPYMYETNGCVSYMTNSDFRKRAKVESPDVYNDYWTRSPSISSSNYIHYIQADGVVSSYKSPTNELGVLLMFSFGV